MTTAPERIYHVSQSQFSVARHYGGCTAFGATYHYDEAKDELVRFDVWQSELAKNKQAQQEYSERVRKAYKELQTGFVGF